MFKKFENYPTKSAWKLYPYGHGHNGLNNATNLAILNKHFSPGIECIPSYVKETIPLLAMHIPKYPPPCQSMSQSDEE